MRWIPIAFEALAKNMATPEPPLRIPLSGYLDALTDHVDGGYVKVQVGIEEFCHEPPKKAAAAYRALHASQQTDDDGEGIARFGSRGARHPSRTCLSSWEEL